MMAYLTWCVRSCTLPRLGQQFLCSKYPLRIIRTCHICHTHIHTILTFLVDSFRGNMFAILQNHLLWGTKCVSYQIVWITRCDPALKVFDCRRMIILSLLQLRLKRYCLGSGYETLWCGRWGACSSSSGRTASCRHHWTRSRPCHT